MCCAIELEYVYITLPSTTLRQAQDDIAQADSFLSY